MCCTEAAPMCCVSACCCAGAAAGWKPASPLPTRVMCWEALPPVLARVSVRTSQRLPHRHTQHACSGAQGLQRHARWPAKWITCDVNTIEASPACRAAATDAGWQVSGSHRVLNRPARRIMEGSSAVRTPCERRAMKLPSGRSWLYQRMAMEDTMWRTPGRKNAHRQALHESPRQWT